MASNLGKRIKELRERVGLSQQGLADATGLSLSFVTKLEQGEKVNPSWQTVRKLARALGVTLGAFEVDDTPEAKPARGRKRK